MEQKDIGIDEYEYKRFKILFKCVMAQAAHDAFISRSKKKIDQIEKARAYVFLCGGENLRTICDIADVSYARIVDIMQNGQKKYEDIMDELKTVNKSKKET